MIKKPLTYYVVLGISLTFLTLTFDPKIGGVFLGMLILDYFIFQHLPTRINQNQIPNNGFKALSAAVFAFVIFFAVTVGATMFLQSTAFLQGTIDTTSLSSSVQSIMRHGFASTGLNPSEPIFADSILLTYYTFGFVIPLIETRMLIRLMEWITRSFNVSIERFNFRLAMVYTALAGLFVWLHANVKGVEDNVALLMTFIFAIITFELARRFKEMESATDLHVINNIVFIFNKIGI